MGLQPAFRRGGLFALLTVTMCFGWWPFNFVPANDAQFLPEEGALRFNAKYESEGSAARGLAYGREVLDTSSWDGITIVVELRGRARGAGLGVFLEFFEGRGRRKPPLMIAQWQDHLALRSRRPVAEVERGYAEIGARDCFAGGEFVRLMISSRGNTTYVSVNGKGVETRNDFPLVGEDNRFVGELVLGNSSVGTLPFTGEIRKLAIYDGFYRGESEALAGATPAVEYDMTRWASVGGSDWSAGAADQGLYVPAKVVPLQRRFFNSIWTRQWDRVGVLSDVIVNTLGFIPVGLCFAAVARRRFRSRSAVFVFVAAASFGLSFVIEWAQGYLVHRDSSQLDVLLNTVSGTLALLVPRKWILFL